MQSVKAINKNFNMTADVDTLTKQITVKSLLLYQRKPTKAPINPIFQPSECNQMFCKHQKLGILPDGAK